MRSFRAAARVALLAAATTCAEPVPGNPGGPVTGCLAGEIDSRESRSTAASAPVRSGGTVFRVE